ncbi:Lysophospholipase, partial [Aspergillus sclerotialis]
MPWILRTRLAFLPPSPITGMFAVRLSGTMLTLLRGRALSYQLIGAENGGPSYTWSSIGASSGFQNADMPMPVLVADGRYPGQLIIPRNATIYEFNPWEFGTFDPTVYGFAPIEFLGSKFV